MDKTPPFSGGDQRFKSSYLHHHGVLIPSPAFLHTRKSVIFVDKKR